MANKIKDNESIIVLLNCAFQAFCAIPAWLPGCLNNATDRMNEARAMIELIESSLFGSYKGYVSGIDGVSSFQLYDRFLWILKKHPELKEKVADHNGITIKSLSNYFKKIDKLSHNIFLKVK